MSRISKEQYMSEEAKQLEIELKKKIQEDKEEAIVKNILSKFSLSRKQVILDLLSLELATK